MIIEALEKETLDNRKLIVVKNINEGLERYKNEVIDYSTETFNEAFDKYYKLLEEIFIEDFIFDFYKENISKNSLDIIKNNIEEKEFKLIEELYNNSKEYTHFYKSSDKNLMSILLKLSLKELYFTTFYFSKLTVWSNYNQKFVVFKEK